MKEVTGKYSDNVVYKRIIGTDAKDPQTTSSRHNKLFRKELLCSYIHDRDVTVCYSIFNTIPNIT